MSATTSIAMPNGGIGPAPRLAAVDNGDGTLSPLFAKQSAAYATRSDTFTGTASGVTVNCSAKPLKWWSIQAVQSGVVSLWTVVLEGSLDGTNFFTLATHTNATGTGVIVAPAAAVPVLYFRSRCSALTLGLGTGLTVLILGME